MARLVIFDDRVRGFELPSHPILIGRSKKNDLPIHDGLLSRKHCSIVPGSGGYRLLDLKSSNGTYLNGKRIEKVDLSVDDIIEIGGTVMVFMEDGVWNRGEGLAQLRNPLKAQELIGRIKLRHGQAGRPSQPVGSRSDGGSSTTGSGSRSARRPRRGSRRSTVEDPGAFPDLEEALESFITHRAVLLLIRSSPELRRVVVEVLREALPSRRGSGAAASPAELRARVRAGVRARLSRREKGTRPGGGRGEPRSGAEEGAGDGESR
jgi:hypothetical protein